MKDFENKYYKNWNHLIPVISKINNEENDSEEIDMEESKDKNNCRNYLTYLLEKCDSGEISNKSKLMINKVVNEELANDNNNSRKQLKIITNNPDLYEKSTIRHDVRFNKIDEYYFNICKKTFKENNSITLKSSNNIVGSIIELVDESCKKTGKPYDLSKEFTKTILKTKIRIKEGSL